MMELQHLMATPGCTIYPIFYELQPSDLVDRQNLKKWQKCWKEKARKVKHNQDYRININTWPESLKRLRSIAGTIIPSQQTNYEKLSEIVSHICNILPPPSFYADPFIKGKETTVQTIQDHYNRILQENKDVGLIVLGVAGIAGSGKTTLCETMVDCYNRSEFPGRSILLEFPTQKADQEQIMSRLKIVLEKITTAHKCMIESITNLNQAISLLNQVKKVRRYFLAIDNVCEWSEQYVQQILEILIATNTNDGTTTKPKVIVTGRSEALLKRLMGVVDVINVPELKEEEAVDIILSYGRCWELYKSKQSTCELDIKTILKNNVFHPLLLKTIGNIMSHIIQKDGYGWEQCIRALKSTSLGLKRHQGETTPFIQGEIENVVLNALQVNYSHLEENLKNIFIDIAILRAHNIYSKNILMLKDYRNIQNMQLQVASLEYYGLWRVFRGLNKEITSIQIHDLYIVLAQKEAKAKGNDRFLLFLDGEITIAPSNSLSKVTRIMNYPSDEHQRKIINATNLKGLDFSELLLDKVELLDLHADDINILYEAWRCATTPIQSFVGNVGSWLFRKKIDWRNDLCLHSLCILNLECGYSITRLDALKFALNLQSLKLTKCYVLKDMKGVEKMKRLQELELNGGPNDSIYDHMTYTNSIIDDHTINNSLHMVDLKRCLKLKTLSVKNFGKLKSLANLHCPSSLERLKLHGIRKLVDVGDIASFGDNLVNIYISLCPCIKEIPCMALPKLETIWVNGCEGLEVMMHGGVICDQNFPCLKDMTIFDCPRLKMLPPITKTSGLESFHAATNEICGGYSSIEHTTCIFNFFESRLGSDVSTLNINVSREQLIFLLNSGESTALSGSTNLKELGIKMFTGYNVASICRHGVDNCTCYANLAMDSTSIAWECSTIPRRLSLSFLSELRGLTKLQLEEFDFITSLEELCCLTNLSDLRLEGFAVLERLPDLSLLNNLKKLSLIRCSSLEDLPALQNVRSLHLRDCRSLRRLPHSWSATSLKILYIYCCPALENFQDFRKNWSCLTSIDELGLDYDRFCSTTVIDAISPDFSDLTHIRILVLDDFPASSLSNFKWPKRVDRLVLSGCNMEYGSQLDLSNLRVDELTIAGYTPSISCSSHLYKWPQTLRYLILSGVFNIDELYPCLNLDITGLSQLRDLEFVFCDTVRSLGCVICPPNLERLEIVACKALEEIPDVSNLINLQTLKIIVCKSLEMTPDVSNLVNLREIRLSDCPSLERLPGYSRRSECRLDISKCPRLKTCS